MSVLVCDNVHKKQQDNNSIRNFNFNFLDSKVYAIVGKSDSGKDMLLDIITGKVKTTSGCVYLDGEPLFNNNTMNSRICYLNNNTKFPKTFSVKTIFKYMNIKFPKWDNKYA